MTEGEIELNAGAADDAPVVRFTAQLPYSSFTTAVQRAGFSFIWWPHYERLRRRQHLCQLQHLVVGQRHVF